MQNEPPEWCPQWAWDEAYRLASQVVAERGPRMETFQPMVARALVDAERRGIGRAKNATCDGCATGVPINGAGYHQQAGFTFPCTASAIRQLGDAPCD